MKGYLSLNVAALAAFYVLTNGAESVMSAPKVKQSKSKFQKSYNKTQEQNRRLRQMSKLPQGGA